MHSRCRGHALQDRAILAHGVDDPIDMLSHVGTTPVAKFAAEETDAAIDERVAAALVKSRAGNAELLRTISSLIADAGD